MQLDFESCDLMGLWREAELARMAGDVRSARRCYRNLVEHVFRTLNLNPRPRNIHTNISDPDLIRLGRAAFHAAEALLEPIERWPNWPSEEENLRSRRVASDRGTSARPIVGFWHIACAHDWRTLVAEQFDRLRFSGLLEQSARIYVTLLGDTPSNIFADEPRIEIVHRSSDLEEFEIPALAALQAWCHGNAGDVYYIHTKGVFSGRRFPTVADWRELLEYFVIDRHADCLRALKCSDLAGANWHLKPWPHFSGNFWWARSEYIRSLPDVEEFATRNGDRRSSERWIGEGTSPRVACLHQSLVNHYHEPYPSELYKSRVRGLQPVPANCAWQELSAWKGLENRIQPYLERIMPISVVVELGVQFGYSLFSLATAIPEAQIIGVDPYGSHIPHHQRHLIREGGANVTGTVEAESWVRRHLEQFPRVQLWKMTSAEAARKFEHPIDVLHIDSVHTYEGVAQDFALWEPKVRPGGCILFHDTSSFPNDVGRFFAELPGEKAEIQEFNGLGIWYKPLPQVEAPRDWLEGSSSDGEARPLLSVLIPTIPERQESFQRIHQKLRHQIAANGLDKQVEILSFCDDRAWSVGTKRNLLMARATGAFVVFVDDDDDVDDSYLAILTDVIRKHSAIDCVGFLGQMTWAGKLPEPTIYSLEYRESGQLGERPGYRVHLRPPQHVNPIRRSIALRFPFPSLNCGEDLIRSQDLVRAGALKQEYFFGQRYMYHYLFNPSTTATQQVEI